MISWHCSDGHELEREEVSEYLTAVSAFCPTCKKPTVPAIEELSNG